ncbi:hypothetical protein [Paenibacillus albus]|uniref:Uncharacterized protein n=1 Tax=Paenibacillus albus TaxID=2495582 RepID=A0A3S9A1Q6_9BACL|nr:hypothetical protein [Paenibacillus albus]AZN39626.1 hypothetical protein EJC50_08105 [Paenibacillus albus]
MANQPFMVPADLYNRIFAAQTSDPSLKVDYEVWTLILAGLPEGYKLPDWTVLSTISKPTP